MENGGSFLVKTVETISTDGMPKIAPNDTIRQIILILDNIV